MSTRSFPASDWKLFRKLHKVTLDRFCERVLAEIASISADTTNSAHGRYLAIYKLIHERDKKLEATFDGFSRSQAARQLALMQHQGLVTEDEMARFGPAVQEEVRIYLNLGRL